MHNYTIYHSLNIIYNYTENLVLTSIFSIMEIKPHRYTFMNQLCCVKRTSENTDQLSN